MADQPLPPTACPRHPEDGKGFEVERDVEKDGKRREKDGKRMKKDGKRMKKDGKRMKKDGKRMKNGDDLSIQY